MKLKHTRLLPFGNRLARLGTFEEERAMRETGHRTRTQTELNLIVRVSNYTVALALQYDDL